MVAKRLGRLFGRIEPFRPAGIAAAPPIFDYDGGSGGPSATLAFTNLGATQSTLAAIRPGWTVERTLLAFWPLVLLELRPVQDRTGIRAYWCLDRTGRFLANDVDALPDPILSRARDTLLCAIAGRRPGDGADPVTTTLCTLDRGFALGLIRRVFADHSPMVLLDRPLAGTAGDSGRLRVEVADDRVSLVVDERLHLPIRLGGAVLRGFEPGWAPLAVVTLFLPLVLVELGHEDNERRATWVLDETLRRIDDEGFRDPRSVARIRAVAPPLLRRYRERVLALDGTPPDPDLAVLLRLGANARIVLFRLCRDLVCPPPEEILAGSVREPIVLPRRTGQNRDLVLPPDGLARAVRHDLFAAGVEAIRTGRFVWPSPVDGSEAELEAVFVPQDYTVVYQFADRNGLRFLVATGDRRAQLVGLMLPAANLMIGNAYPPAQWFVGHVGHDVWTMLLEHCLRHDEVLAGRRRTSASPVVNLFIGPPLLHIGHYLWNDLSGVAALLEAVGERMPRSLVMGAPDGQAEFFGRLPALFPALAGRIDHDLADTGALVRHALRSDEVPIRFTRDYVDAALRGRIARLAADTEAGRAIAAQAAALGGRMVVMVGIRLEDRTMVDPLGFHLALVAHLAQHHPGTVLVFDGRNARPGGRPGEIIVSITDGLATRSPLDAERDLVSAVRDRSVGLDVTVLDTIGAPMEASLAWCAAARCCIAVWGAGLAKYRWIANLPSLVLTSRYNLEHRDDLDIYDSPRWMEQPARMIRPRPDQVVDRPEIVGLATSRIRTGRECFEIAPEAVAGLVDALLAGVAPDRNAVPQLSA